MDFAEPLLAREKKQQKAIFRLSFSSLFFLSPPSLSLSRQGKKNNPNTTLFSFFTFLHFSGFYSPSWSNYLRFLIVMKANQFFYFKMNNDNISHEYKRDVKNHLDINFYTSSSLINWSIHFVFSLTILFIFIIIHFPLMVVLCKYSEGGENLHINLWRESVCVRVVRELLYILAVS